MRARSALLMLLLLTATACGPQSRLERGADVRVGGVVLRGDGTPLAAARVALVKDLDAGQALGGFFLGLASLGSACLLEPPPEICRGARVAVTAADGTFEFRMRGSDTQGSVGNASRFLLTTAAPAPDGGAVASVSFEIQTEDLRLPALRLWDVVPSLDTPDGVARLSWAPPHLESTAGVDYAIVAEDGAGAVVWREGAASGGGDLDSRVLEDGEVALRGLAATRGEGPGTVYDFTYRTGPLPVRGAAMPLSRKANCSYTSGDRAVAVAPCPVTDGILGGRPHREGASVTVELAQAADVDLVVVRGCDAGCAVEVSADGQGWAPLASLASPYAAVAAPAGTRGRLFRVSDAGGVTELSVWPPGAGGPPSVIMAGSRGRPGPALPLPGAPAGDAGEGLGWLAGAGLAAVALTTGLFLASGISRRRWRGGSRSAA